MEKHVMLFEEFTEFEYDPMNEGIFRDINKLLANKFNSAQAKRHAAEAMKFDKLITEGENKIKMLKGDGFATSIYKKGIGLAKHGYSANLSLAKGANRAWDEYKEKGSKNASNFEDSQLAIEDKLAEAATKLEDYLTSIEDKDMSNAAEKAMDYCDKIISMCK